MIETHRKTSDVCVKTIDLPNFSWIDADDLCSTILYGETRFVFRPLVRNLGTYLVLLSNNKEEQEKYLFLPIRDLMILKTNYYR